MNRQLVHGLIVVLATGFLGQAIATDRAPLVAPVIEMVGDLTPTADGNWVVKIDQIVVDPQGLFKDNAVLRREPLKLQPAYGGIEAPKGRSRFFVKSPDASAGRWRLVAAYPVASSMPAVKNGLRITTTADRDAVAADEPLTITIHLRNVTDRPLAMHDFSHVQGWQVRIGDWRVHHLVDDERAPAVTTVLKPGEATSLPIKLDPKQLEYVRQSDDGNRERREQLEPGVYYVYVSRTLTMPPDNPVRRQAPRWTGELTSAGMRIEITEPGQ